MVCKIDSLFVYAIPMAYRIGKHPEMIRLYIICNAWFSYCLCGNPLRIFLTLYLSMDA